MEESGFNDFLNHYYQRQSTDGVMEAFQYRLATGAPDDHALEIVCYAFGRMGQLAPELVPEFQKLLADQSDYLGREMVLDTLSQTASPEARQFLQQLVGEVPFRPSTPQIEAALRHWRAPDATALERSVKGPGDLDFLWMEFFVTGRRDAVQKVIDTLSRPDRVRERLNHWLESSNHTGFFAGRRLARLRKNLSRMGAWMDKDAKSILSPQDMDLFAAMDGLTANPARLDAIRSILPFSLSAEDLDQIATKAAAKWSLASISRDHPAVLTVCDEEARRRSGQSRLTLLEILGRLSLVSDDMGAGFNRLFEALDPDPTSRGAYLEACDEKYATLDALSPEKAVPPAPAVSASECTGRCIEATGKASSYCARMTYFAATDEAPTSTNELIVWNLEYARPDRFRVFQRAGQDGDAWVTVEDIHFRGPVFAPADARAEMWQRDLECNRSLLTDPYLNIMAVAAPVSIQQYAEADRSFLLLDYSTVDANRALLRPWLGDTVAKAHFWIDGQDYRLAKADLLITGSSMVEGGNGRLHMVHLFGAYDADVRIIPPPFQLTEVTWN